MLLRRRGWSLRTKIIAWSFIPTAIILCAVALVTIYAYQKVTEDLVVGRNRELARLSAGQLAADLSEYTTILSGLARTADIYRGDSRNQHLALVQARNRLVVFDGGVMILDNHGRVAAAEPERPDVVGQDWSDRSYFRQMVHSQRPVFSDITADGPQGANVIVVAVPIIAEQGEFVGTMAGMFRLGATSVSSFYGGIVKLRVGERGAAYVVDSNGRVIYHSDADRIGDDVSTQTVVRNVLSGKADAMQTRDLTGQAIVATYAPVPGTGWGFVVEESWAGLMDSSKGYRDSLLLLLALGLVVPVFVVTAGVRRITKPIEVLGDAAREVARGELGQTITVATGDELEELAKHFNVMSTQLQESYANLERKVDDRTRELSTLNAIAAVVSRSLEIEEILNDALGKILEATAMEAGAALRLDEKSKTFNRIAHQGLSDEMARYVARLPLDIGAPEPAPRDRGPFVMQVADFAESGLKTLLEREGFQLVVVVPLIARGKVFGTINLATRTMRTLSSEDLSLLASIGNQIGMAVENAQLYEDAERAAAAAERSRLARDLHDAVTQTLFSASLIAEVLPRLWERSPDEGKHRLEELRQLTRGALAEMRTLLLELRPSALTEAALGDLLRQLAEATIGRARVPIGVTVDGEVSLPPDVKIGLYRIAQEALNNIAKHSAASEAKLSLHCRPERVELSVSDDGRGFDARRMSSEHLGLGIMNERAEAIGARLTVKSQPGRGTQVLVIWPGS